MSKSAVGKANAAMRAHQAREERWVNRIGSSSDTSIQQQPVQHNQHTYVDDAGQIHWVFEAN